MKKKIGINKLYGKPEVVKKRKKKEFWLILQNMYVNLKLRTPTQIIFFFNFFMFQPAMFTAQLALSASYFTVVGRH